MNYSLNIPENFLKKRDIGICINSLDLQESGGIFSMVQYQVIIPMFGPA